MLLSTLVPCVYSSGFNRKDINIYFSSIFTVTCSAQTTVRIIITLRRELLWGPWFILALAGP